MQNIGSASGYGYIRKSGRHIRPASDHPRQKLGWKSLVPIPSLAILMVIGIVDLISTAVLHSQGKIEELNPILRPIIDQSEWMFAAIKGLTLLVAYVAMLHYAQKNRRFVQLASRLGVVLYLGLWVVWFTMGATGSMPG